MSDQRKEGFTLIEVMVALLVVAIAYTGVATAITGFADQRMMLVERHTSHRVAWNRMMEQYLVSNGIDIQQRDFAEPRGAVQARGGSWRWTMTEQNAAGKGLVRYQVDVFSPGATKDNPPSGSLSAFFTAPRRTTVQ